MTDEERRRLTGRVIHLLDLCVKAYRRDDRPEFIRLREEATGLDAFCVSAILGGIMLGEIPNPETDPDGWAQFVAEKSVDYGA
jgi:hypothetical protein